MHRLLHAYKRAMREAYLAADIQLPIANVRVLKSVGYLPACTVQAVADRMRRDKSQITRIVKELREAELVQARCDPEDGRSRILTPTAAGRRLLVSIAEAERNAGVRMVRGLPADAVEGFVRIAEAMVANLENERDDE